MTFGQVLRWLGVVLYLALTAFIIFFGVLYTTVDGSLWSAPVIKDHMLWFHAAAVPEAARPAILPLYTGLMKLVGTFALGLALFMGWAALGPVRAGSKPAAVVLAIALAIPVVGAAYVAERLRAETGAPTGWGIMGILLAVNVVALLACLFGHPPRQSEG